jgi:hypothetical protein
MESISGGRPSARDRALWSPSALAKARTDPLNTASKFHTFGLTIGLARVFGQIGPGVRSPCCLVALRWQMPWQTCWAGH